MIAADDLYNVLTAVAPLYVAMGVAYVSVKWWRIFTPDQCAGVNRFVALFAVPLLSFHFISTNDPYAMNWRLLAADVLQKLTVLAALAVWAKASARGCLEWAVTLFSLATLPNTLVMGIPLLKGMYGPASGTLMVQIVVLQCIVWYTLALFVFEFRGARLLILQQFPDNAGSIVSFRVETDVLSLDGKEPLQAEAKVGDDGRLHVTIRKSTSSVSEACSRRSCGLNSGILATPRQSNLSKAEIYSLQSSQNPTPRGTSFSHADFYALANGHVRTGAFASPRDSNLGSSVLDDEVRRGAWESWLAAMPASAGTYSPVLDEMRKKTNEVDVEAGRDLNIFVWSSSSSPASEGSGSHAFGHEHGVIARPIDYNYDNYKEANHDEYGRKDLSSMNKIHGTGSKDELQSGAAKPASMLPAIVMTKLILIMVWRKLIRNPNTYSSLLGVIWSLVAFRWRIEMPVIIARSISILSDAGLGMAMFSLGAQSLFMAQQQRIIACGNSVAALAMAVRFVAGPVVMAAASIAVGLRGIHLYIAIVQAALPQGIVPFVFAKEYNVHPDILSTGVIFGMLIALPIALVYYIVLGL